ncbi:nonribosomal peptide synthase [Penicillium odoratum]|uniref:nonribosomal peptide synthase n=1 Tax=Penicillium odoratum TaxID=1167516 RepID=UPI002546790F|nr:nonribosomal peptide synthase [Penicillium odoratum]KAJ5746490.1 nonribosomal peptide synthase [Penicillium odoratum]
MNPTGTPSAADLAKIQQWNQHAIPSVDACIHDLIKQRSQNRLLSTAVCAWDGDFTYEDLDIQSAKLANYLQAKGTVPETKIALYLRRSRWSPVLILAVLQAGGAFVLLDPSHPVDRLKSMCADTNAAMVLCFKDDTETSGQLNLPICVIDIDNEDATWRREPREVNATAQFTNTAYVAFTSGSTGKPKGIQIEHGQYCSSAAAHANAWSIGAASRVFQFASYAFDGSIMEMLTTLMEGGCVCIPSEEDRQNNLVQAFNSFQANFLCLTPSLLKSLNPRDLPTLKNLLVTGELTPQQELDRWADQVHMTITYGPTECSVACSVQEHVSKISDPRNLGRSMGCHLWLVDPSDIKQLAPVGEVGEICIEGPIVGRGYMNAPDQTCASFFEKLPWLSVTQRLNSRVYKTGDLGRYNEDGSIHLLGRKDSQVKIRGQRIELGEIEVQLSSKLQHALEVIVDVVQHTEGDALVVAFLHTPSGSQSQGLLPPSDTFSNSCLKLRDSVKASLPGYMIPTLFLPVASLPLTATGKINRHYLRSLVHDLSVDALDSYIGSGDRRSPSTEREKRLHEAVAQALAISLQRIGMNDDFFALGGNSLTAMKLVSIGRESGLWFTVVDVFAHSNLLSLASVVRHETPEAQIQLVEPSPFALMSGIEDPESFVRDIIAPKLPFARHDDIVDVLPATDMQSYVARFPPHYPLIRLDGKIDPWKVKMACDQLVQRHSVLRTVFASHNDRSVQVVLRKADLLFQYFETDMTISAFEEAFCKYDGTVRVPTSVSGLSFVLVSRSETEHSLIIRLPLPLCDGESWILLLQDWMALYKAQDPIPEPISFAAWASQYIAQQNERTYAFWRQILHGSSMTHLCDATIDLPDEAFVFSVQNIPLLPPPRAITRATLVKLAWALTLAKYTGKTDVVFGQLIHGRAHAHAGEERIAGHLAKIIPVRVINCQDTETELPGLLEQVQRQHLDTMAHDLVDFQNLIDHSTSWPRDTQYGTYILHQDNEYLGEMPSMGGVQVNTSMAYNPLISKAVREFVLVSTPRGQEHELQICTTSVYVDQKRADEMLTTMVEKMHLLASVA